MRVKFKGPKEDLTGKFRKASRAATELECKEYQQMLDEQDHRTRAYLSKIGQTRWARCKSGQHRYSVLTSNAAESMNNVNNSAREYPICKLVDFIRERMQKWFHERFETASSTATILPRKLESELITLQRDAFKMKVQQKEHCDAGSRWGENVGMDVTSYDDWKIMMEAHLYALHDCMWMVLEDGPLKIQMENPERDPKNPDVVQYIPKPKEKWDHKDCKKHNLDNVAKAAIFKTLDPITFSKIKHLKTPMEIWQGHGKLCEGSEDLRKQKIEVLLEKFKSFKMLPEESFDMLDERFHKILNDLALLNHVLSPKEKNVRLLRSLPAVWYTKATAMEEGRNLENYNVQASEGTCPRSCDTPSTSQPPSSKMENYEVELEMMIKEFQKFKKFFKQTDAVRRPSKGKLQVSNSPPESYLCYNCRKPSHWKSACPYPKVEKYGEGERNEKKKKTMVAAESDDSSNSSSDEEALVCMERRAEKSNHEDCWTMSEDDTLCLMAKDDADLEVTSQTSCSSSYESTPTSENLFEKFKKMMKDFEEINLKHSSLTEENKLLSEENLKLTESRKSQLNEITQLKAENESLSEKNISTNEVILTRKRIRNIYEVMWDDVKEACLISKDKDEEVNEGDIMKPTEFIPFGSLPLKTSRRSPDSDSAEPTKNHGQPSEIPDFSHGDNSRNEKMKVGGATIHFKKLEAKCSSPAFYEAYLEMIGAQELVEFLHLEISFKYEEEVLEFYKNGRISTIQSKKNPQRSIQVIESTIGGTAVKFSQKKMKKKLHLPYSGIDIGKLSSKNLDWNTIRISGQIPSGPAKKADLKNDYKLVLELNQPQDSPQDLNEEMYQDQNLPSPSSQALVDEVDKFMKLYYVWRAWKIGNSVDHQLLEWDQQLKNEKIIKRCLGLPINCVYLEAEVEDFHVFTKISPALHINLTEAVQENAATPYSSTSIFPDEMLESWTRKVQGLIESALESQKSSFRQDLEKVKMGHNEILEKTEEKYSSNLKEISQSINKTLEIISMFSNLVSNSMIAYASDCHLQLKEAMEINQQIATITASLQKQMSFLQMDIRSALAVSSANQVVTLLELVPLWPTAVVIS
ncbi:unnamed protein product [Cuscuta campestris]|uniref:CCHC-type domain-containing protein n=1 Tax=Cuscuta campestris TaxID=132261 RepID=A0A484M3Q3_9ASTE|nr:unnamed protein product [Cuscuta campestris]